MAKPASSLVSVCPDCGGILQPVAFERLTSLEVASSDVLESQRVQCLLCGYEEERRPDGAGQAALPL